MGRNKLLTPWNGEPMIRHVVRTVTSVEFAEVIVVVGYEAELVTQALEGLPCQTVLNAQAVRGMASSIVAGVHAASRLADTYLIVLGDMPRVEPELLQAILHQVGTDRIVVPRCGDREGNPVAFGSVFHDALLSLRGDEGARSLIELNRHHTVYVDWHREEDFEDIDEPNDVGELTV